MAAAAPDMQKTPSRTRRLWRWFKPLIPDLIVWAKDASRRMDEVGVRLYVAAIAYRTIFAMVAFLSTLGIVALLLGIDPLTIADGDINAVPNDVEEVSRQRAEATLELGTTSAWVAGLIGFMIGLYTLSSAFAALCEVLDRIHGVHQYRHMSRRYARGAVVALLFLLLASTTALLLLLTTEVGDTIFGNLGFDRLNTLWEVVFKFVLPMVAVVITFGFLLRYGSHARPPWAQVLPGAAVASTAWLIMVGGFVGYVAIFNGFEAYGALANTAALLVFGWLQAYLLILVAFFSEEIAMTFALVPGVRRAEDGSSLEIDANQVRAFLGMSHRMHPGAPQVLFISRYDPGFARLACDIARREGVKARGVGVADRSDVDDALVAALASFHVPASVEDPRLLRGDDVHWADVIVTLDTIGEAMDLPVALPQERLLVWEFDEPDDADEVAAVAAQLAERIGAFAADPLGALPAPVEPAPVDPAGVEATE